MNSIRRFVPLVLFLAVGCMSATQYYGSRANRLVVANDTYLRRNPQVYAPHAASQYTRFLTGLPAHPSLDGIRLQIHQKRAEAYRWMQREDLAKQDQAEAARIQATSPLFRGSGVPGTVLPDAGSTRPPAPESGARPSVQHPATPTAPFPGMVPRRPTGVTLDVGLGAAYLNRRLMRSDSRSHGDFTYDLDDDLGVNRTTGYPRLTLQFRGKRLKSYFAVDFWSGAFNGEAAPPGGIAFDGWTSVPGENVRTRFGYTSVCAYVGFSPSAAQSGKVDIEIGIKHAYLETRLHGEFSGEHTDALHVPLFYPGIHVKHAVGKRVILGGTLRAGAMVWSSGSFSMVALGFETDLQAHVKMNDRLSLGAGIRFEHLSFDEVKSDDRRKQAGIGFGGGFAEAVFRF